MSCTEKKTKSRPQPVAQPWIPPQTKVLKYMHIMNPFELNNKMLKRIYILQTGLQNAYTLYQSHIPILS